VAEHRVNVDTPDLPDPQVCAWLEANHIDPGQVLATQHVLVTEDSIVYIGYPPGPKELASDGRSWRKQAYSVPLLVRPEAFGLDVVES